MSGEQPRGKSAKIPTGTGDISDLSPPRDWGLEASRVDMWEEDMIEEKRNDVAREEACSRGAARAPNHTVSSQSSPPGTPYAINTPPAVARIEAQEAATNTASSFDRLPLELSVQPSGAYRDEGDAVDGPTANDKFGESVSMSNNGARLIVGAPYHDGDELTHRGLVRVYKEQGGKFTQIGPDLLGDAAYDNFGDSVAISGNGERIAVGAPGQYGIKDSSPGLVKVFEHHLGTWHPIFDLIFGETSGDHSGESVSLSLDGSIVAIGARENDGVDGKNSGQVRIYKVSSGGWTQLGKDIDGEAPWDAWTQRGHDLDGETEGDRSGFSVSLSADGKKVAVGAIWNDGVNGTKSGQVRVHEYNKEMNEWLQIGDDIDGEAALDEFGSSVSLSSDGTIVAVGAILNRSGKDHVRKGHVRIYRFDSDAWLQVGSDFDGESEGDYFGGSVSLAGDGSRVAIGATRYNANGNKRGYVRVIDI